MKVQQDKAGARYRQANTKLFQAIAAIESVKDAQEFFEDLCTPAELQAMADRWLVVEPIKNGQAYRSIHEDTGVSVTTIGRVARNLSFGTGGYDLIFERVKRGKHAVK